MKIKTTQATNPYSQQNHPHVYYNHASPLGTNGLSHQSPATMHATKNGPVPFLPRITGASAFSNYSTNTGNSNSINHKVIAFICTCISLL